MAGIGIYDSRPNRITCGWMLKLDERIWSVLRRGRRKSEAPGQNIQPDHYACQFDYTNMRTYGAVGIFNTNCRAGMSMAAIVHGAVLIVDFAGLVNNYLEIELAGIGK